MGRHTHLQPLPRAQPVNYSNPRRLRSARANNSMNSAVDNFTPCFGGGGGSTGSLSQGLRAFATAAKIRAGVAI